MEKSERFSKCGDKTNTKRLFSQDITDELVRSDEMHAFSCLIKNKKQKKNADVTCFRDWNISEMGTVGVA